MLYSCFFSHAILVDRSSLPYPDMFHYAWVQLKERTQKLEYWRLKEKHREEKKKEKKELLRRKSSTWVDEDKLEKTILEVIVDIKPL